MIKKTVFIVGMLMSFNAFANLTVQNNTNTHATAQTTFSPCSSSIGGAGIVSPHSSMDIPKEVLDMFCRGGNCTVKIFMNKSCGGKPIGTIVVSQDRGITSIRNDNRSYRMSGSSSTLVIDQA